MHVPSNNFQGSKLREQCKALQVAHTTIRVKDFAARKKGSALSGHDQGEVSARHQLWFDACGANYPVAPSREDVIAMLQIAYDQ